MVELSKRLVEVDEILKYLSEENLQKIPEELRKAIKENKDKNYIWKYDKTKELKEQDVNIDTIALVAYLNMKYLLNEEQKKIMNEIVKINSKIVEEEKRKKYDTDNLFKKEQYEERNEVEKKELILKKENILCKILKTIKKFICCRKK